MCTFWDETSPTNISLPRAVLSCIIRVEQPVGVNEVLAQYGTIHDESSILCSFVTCQRVEVTLFEFDKYFSSHWSLLRAHDDKPLLSCTRFVLNHSCDTGPVGCEGKQSMIACSNLQERLTMVDAFCGAGIVTVAANTVGISVSKRAGTRQL